MQLGELADWQWRDYPMYHQDRRNLLLHIVAVPAFLLGNTLIVIGAVAWFWPLMLGGLLVSAAAFGVQGLGHKSEPVPPVPFSGPANVVGRLLVEQWVTFPRFVLSGMWAENLRRATPAGQ